MKKYLVISSMLLAILSCNKSEDTPCTTSTASLTGTYKVTGTTYKETSSSPEDDLFVNRDACEKDDVLILKANDVYESKDLGTTCSPAGGDTGTWSLSGSNMIVDGETFAIKSFNCQTLVITTSGALVPGDLTTLTLQKQ